MRGGRLGDGIDVRAKDRNEGCSKPCAVVTDQVVSMLLWIGWVSTDNPRVNTQRTFRLPFPNSLVVSPPGRGESGSQRVHSPQRADRENPMFEDELPTGVAFHQD